MATPISDEELQLKKRARRRLIGAIALVTVVAVFLPMVLDHEPRPVNQDINIQIPAQNAGTFTSKIVPVIPGGADAKTESAPAANPAPAVAPAAPVEAPKAPVVAAKAEPAKAPPVAVAVPTKESEAAPPKVAVTETKAPTPEAKAKPKTPSPPSTDSEAAPPKPAASEAPAKAKAKPEPKAETKAKSAKAGDGGAFVVQVAALNDADKAKQMREQIAAAGVKAYTEVVPTSKGSVTRVRAGPFATRAAADKARDKLKELGLAGNVVPK
jgi:DedD protein